MEALGNGPVAEVHQLGFDAANTGGPLHGLDHVPEQFGLGGAVGECAADEHVPD